MDRQHTMPLQNRRIDRNTDVVRGRSRCNKGCIRFPDTLDDTVFFIRAFVAGSVVHHNFCLRDTDTYATERQAKRIITLGN